MSGDQVPVTRTVVTMKDYARAVVRAWPEATQASVAVLWAQYIIETGGAACWNFNVGNVKAVNGDGYDFHCLRGVWEGVQNDVATRLIASGEARLDPSADHARAVGLGKVSVIFEPPHPATRFRAFHSLDDAMRDHLALLRKRFAVAWPAVLDGSIDDFAHRLHDAHYFTASPEAYAAGMRRPFADFMASASFEDAKAVSQDAVPTVPALPEDTDIVHADPSLYSLDVEPPESEPA